MKYLITGTIHTIKPIQTFSKGFKKQELVLIPDGATAQEIPLECHGEDCAMLDEYSTREKVEITFTITGREWQGRHFCNLKILNMRTLDMVKPPADAEQPRPQQAEAGDPNINRVEDMDEDDVPF